MVLCKVPAGLREKKHLSRPAGTLLSCEWEEKRAVRGSGKGKPVRETRKEISFGSGRGKECRQTRRKPKCSHVSQKNRRLYAKTGLQREKVLCRPVLILLIGADYFTQFLQYKECAGCRCKSHCSGFLCCRSEFRKRIAGTQNKWLAI